MARGRGGPVENWIVARVRQRSVRQLVAWGAVVAVGALIGVANARYVRNFLSGPTTLSAAEVGAIGDVTTTPRYFARVEGTETVDTGIQQVEVRTRHGQEVGRSVTASFFALAVGDRFLIVKTSSGPARVVEGHLEPMPAELQQHLFGTAEMRAARARFYPFYLDTESFRTAGYWAIAIGSVLVLFLLATAVPAWKRLRDPSTHPVVARVATWGDPISLAVEIEREDRHPWRRSGGVSITDHYIVSSGLFTFDVLRLADLLWAYKKVTKKSVNFVPVGKDFHAVLVCAGGSVEWKGSEKEVEEALRHAASRAPWAAFGYSKELEGQLRRNAAAFVTAIATRRRHHQAHAHA
jgi:hypothetical protein